MQNMTGVRYLTDGWGAPLVERLDSSEPPRGSVVLTNGEHGTAWQRFHSDGLWHRVGGGRGRPWVWLAGRRNLVLVYSATAERVE